MPKETFFHQDSCDRCGTSLDVRSGNHAGGRVMSWFTDQTICMGCADAEMTIKKKLLEFGYDTKDYEGCGYVPKLDKIVPRRPTA